MTIVAITRPKVKAHKVFDDYELKKMSESNFRPSGWHSYSESPYAQYKKQMDAIKGESDDSKE